MFKSMIFMMTILFFIIVHSENIYSQFAGDIDQRIQSFIKIPGLDNVPPLITDMPLDCMVGYIVMDSLSRTKDAKEVYQEPLTTSLDSLRTSARFMYAVTDYDPRLMRRYITSTRDSVSRPIGPNSKYVSFPANSYYGIEHAIKTNRLDEFGKDYAMLTVSHYILRVEIDSVVTGIDTTYPGQPVPWVNVSCTVIQKIKGQIIPSNCRYEAVRDLKDIPNKTLAASNCLNFGYPKDWLTGIGFSDRPLPTGTKIRTVEKGDEYFVFLIHLAFRENADILVPVHQFEANGGLFRINNGLVEDPSNLWGLGISPTIEDFLSRINSNISTIKVWWVGDPVVSVKQEAEPAEVKLVVSPHPFSDYFVISFETSKRERVRIYFSDLLGNSTLILDEIFSKGSHEYTYPTFNFSSGNYILRMELDDIVIAQNVILVK